MFIYCKLTMVVFNLFSKFIFLSFRQNPQEVEWKLPVKLTNRLCLLHPGGSLGWLKC